MSLTIKQHQLFRYIERYIKEHNGVAPSYQEMCAAMQIKSLSGAHRFVMELRKRGYILHDPKKSRAISILKDPTQQPSSGDLTSHPKPTSFVYKPNEEKFGSTPSKTVSIPLYGLIAAGPCIEAIQDMSSFIDLPASMLGVGNHYALRISGDSMSGAAIISGDIAIIRCEVCAQNGDIVVALTQGDQATLKYVYFKDNLVHLKPANPHYATVSLPPNQVHIQGKLTNILRNY